MRRQHLLNHDRRHMSRDTFCGRDSKLVRVVNVPPEPMPRDVCRECLRLSDIADYKAEELAKMMKAPNA